MLDTSKTLEELDGNAGYWDSNNLTLSIAKNLPLELFNSTLLHEILEAINYHLELELKHNQIMSIEVGINKVLKDAGIDISNCYMQ